MASPSAKLRLRPSLLVILSSTIFLLFYILHLTMTKIEDPTSIPPSSSLRLAITTDQGVMPLRIISHNVRYATSAPVLGEHRWAVRQSKLINQLNFVTAGQDSPFVCLQECLHSQIKDIQAGLGDGWSHIGRGRGSGENDGEFSPIFYRSASWEVVRYETRWLSETPKVPSRGWDAVLNRIVTMGEFAHTVTGTRVIIMSTHFDHIGVEARKHSAELLIRFAKEWSATGDGPAPSVVLIGGDFNSAPDDVAYQVMTARGSGMKDIADLIPTIKHYGNHVTYTSFGEPRETPSRIDFLFIQQPRSARVKTFGVLANSFDDQVRVSDHRAVVADLDIII